MKDTTYLLEYNPRSLCHLWETLYLVFIKQLICNRQNQIITGLEEQIFVEKLLYGTDTFLFLNAVDEKSYRAAT